MVVLIFSTGTCALALGLKGKNDPSVLAFTLQILTDMITFFSVSMRMLAEMQSMMSCSQRVYEYT
jgi:hypothetical protein